MGSPPVDHLLLQPVRPTADAAAAWLAGFWYALSGPSFSSTSLFLISFAGNLYHQCWERP